jgi:SAM-dependent methyltransferase
MWPQGFDRVEQSDPWVQGPIEELALKYDTIENHGWYRNLEPTLEELHEVLKEGDWVIDYSAGTGILVSQYLRRHPACRVGFLLVDASPKFLRLALEKLGQDERVAFRWIRYLKEEKRLQLLDEVLPPACCKRGVEVVCSTNAIHLYYDLLDTLKSWVRLLKPGGLALIQSGNILNPGAPHDSWIIDDTVERLQPIAVELVQDDPRYLPFRSDAQNAERMRTYDRLRRKYFLPVKPLTYYQDTLREAGFQIVSSRAQALRAQVCDWADFLCAYHEGVLGWAGGTERIDGQDPSTEHIQLRQQLVRESLSRLFDGDDSFRTTWTYVTCRKPAK